MTLELVTPWQPCGWFGKLLGFSQVCKGYRQVNGKLSRPIYYWR